MTSLFYVNLLHFTEVKWNMTCLLDKIACRICAGCNTEIGHGRFLSCMGAVWHPACFRCHACNLPINDHEVQLIWVNWNFFWNWMVKTLNLWWFIEWNISFLWQFSMSGKRPYHKSCYKEQHHPRCDVCKIFVSVYHVLLFPLVDFVYNCRR